MNTPTNDDIEKLMQRLDAITTVAHVQDIAQAEQAFFASASRFKGFVAISIAFRKLGCHAVPSQWERRDGFNSEGIAHTEVVRVRPQLGNDTQLRPCLSVSGGLVSTSSSFIKRTGSLIVVPPL
jgi:hypothetical protein